MSTFLLVERGTISKRGRSWGRFLRLPVTRASLQGTLCRTRTPGGGSLHHGRRKRWQFDSRSLVHVLKDKQTGYFRPVHVFLLLRSSWCKSVGLLADPVVSVCTYFTSFVSSGVDAHKCRERGTVSVTELQHCCLLYVPFVPVVNIGM